MRIAFYGEHRNRLGESPLWDPRDARLYWADSVAQRIHRAAADGSGLESWDAPSLVGSLALADDGLLVALQDGFHRLDLDSDVFAAIALPEQGNAHVRFNDGKADRQGRFLSGTMRVGEAPADVGKLYRLGHDGSVATLETGIGIANALCFSPDGATLYFADSLQRRIWAYDYDTATGTAVNRRVLIDTAPLGSAPDGATVDAEGCLWVAMVQSQRLARIAPTGEVLRQVDVPVPFPACPAFGGDDLATLFVTSIAEASATFRSDHADAGRMLSITGLDAPGLPEARCALDLQEQP